MDIFYTPDVSKRILPNLPMIFLGHMLISNKKKKTFEDVYIERKKSYFFPVNAEALVLTFSSSSK